MIYLDCGATSFQKPPEVKEAVLHTMETCTSVGRGSYKEADAAAKTVFETRSLAAKLLDAREEQVVFTGNCTHGLNIAIASLIRPGDRVAVSGFEHNAVMRRLYAMGVRPVICGRRLFCPEDTLAAFERALRGGVRAAIFTHVSNVFGYILPVEQLAALCCRYHTPFIVDAAQSAGVLPVQFHRWGAEFVAMPGHKSLLGPQGTGILLCRQPGQPLLYGGTGTQSLSKSMPEELPERLEAGTLNVPGIAGLGAGIKWLLEQGITRIAMKEEKQAQMAACALREMGIRTFSGKNMSGVVSFVPMGGCEETAQKLAQRDVAVRAGLHCAPLAHESAGTVETGTVRMSFGAFTKDGEITLAMEILSEICR